MKQFVSIVIFLIGIFFVFLGYVNARDKDSTTINFIFADILAGYNGGGGGGEVQYKEHNCHVANNFKETYENLWNAPSLNGFAAAWNAEFAPDGILSLNGYQTASTSADRLNLFNALYTPPSLGIVSVAEIECSESNPNSFTYKWTISSVALVGYDSFIFNNEGQIIYYYCTTSTIYCPVAQDFVNTYQNFWNSNHFTSADIQAAVTAFDALFAPGGLLVSGFDSANDSAGREEILKAQFGGPTNITASPLQVVDIYCSETYTNSFIYNWNVVNGTYGYDVFALNDAGQIVFYYISGDYFLCSVGANYKSTYLSLWNAHYSGATIAAAAVAWDAEFAPGGVLVYQGTNATTSVARISIFEELFSSTPNDLTTIDDVYCSESNANSFTYKYSDGDLIGFDSLTLNEAGQVVYYNALY